MRLKTSQTIALEKGKPVQRSTDIELLGTESLAELDEFKLAISSKQINSSEHSFLSVFGNNTKFFYSVEVKSETVGFAERGLGYIEQHENKFFLKRSRPFYFIESGNIFPSQKCRPIPCSEDIFVLVSSYTPTTYVELLTDANSIITSQLPHLPTTVVVDNNSLLGRKNDNIESIPISEIFDREEVADIALKSITQHTKNLILKSSKIDIKRLTADDIQLNARKTAPARKGVIYYDEKDDCLKYNDGKKWRSLMWQEDK
jgi:hypothetical protein